MPRVTITGVSDLNDAWKMLVDKVAKGEITPDLAKAEIDAKTRWLRLYEAQYTLEGKPGAWTYAKRPTKKAGAKADAVIVVPILVEPGTKKLILLKEYRIPVQDYEYHFCAGLLEPGEDVTKAAERELLEETGLKITRVLRVSAPLLSSSGLTDEDVIMVFAECVEDRMPEPEATEDIEVLRLDYGDVADMLDARSPRKISAKTWPVLYMFYQLGKIE